MNDKYWKQFHELFVSIHGREPNPDNGHDRQKYIWFLNGLSIATTWRVAEIKAEQSNIFSEQVKILRELFNLGQSKSVI